jgi:hypothetical protein
VKRETQQCDELRGENRREEWEERTVGRDEGKLFLSLVGEVKLGFECRERDGGADEGRVVSDHLRGARGGKLLARRSARLKLTMAAVAATIAQLYTRQL